MGGRCERVGTRAVAEDAAVGELRRSPSREASSPIFSVTDVWGRLTSGSRLSATEVKWASSFVPVSCATLKI